MGHLRKTDEKERTEELENLIGCVRADALSRIWQNSYQNGTASDFLFGTGKSKEQVFKEKAESCGFFEFEIEAFLEL